MQITLYNVSKKENSTYIPNDSVAHTDVEVILKTPTSKHNPSFDLNTNPTAYNYVKWNGKYYWITEITYVRNGYWRIDCEEDVLASFRDAIKSSSQYITRTSNPNMIDPNLIDNFYPKHFPVAVTSTSTEINYSSHGTYTIGVKSKKGVKYYAMTENTFNFLCQKIFAESQDSLWETIIDAGSTLTKSFLNVMDYVVSCNWLPFDFADGDKEEVSFGYWDSGATARVVRGTVAVVGAQLEIPHATDYTDSNDFRYYVLHIPSVGDFPLDANVLNGDASLTVSIQLDAIGNVIGTVSVGNEHILHFNGTCGTEIQLSSNSVNIGGVASAISTTAGIIGGLASKSAGAVVAGATNGIVSASQLIPQTQTIGGQGSFLQPQADRYIELRCYSMTQSDKNNNYFGSPSMKTGTISGGYFYLIESPQISFGDIWEKRRIVQFLQNGFYGE